MTIHLKHGPCSDHAFVTYIVPIALPQFQEYVDDTEDYINIMLDEKQNQLLQTGRPADDGDRGGHCRHRGRELVRHEHPETDEEARSRGSGKLLGNHLRHSVWVSCDVSPGNLCGEEKPNTALMSLMSDGVTVALLSSENIGERGSVTVRPQQHESSVLDGPARRVYDAIIEMIMPSLFLAVDLARLIFFCLCV